MAAKAGTELVPFSEYSIAKVNAGDLMEILQENVGGQITEFDLQRAKVPTGGMTAWVLPSLDGDDEIATEPRRRHRLPPRAALVLEAVDR